MRRLTLAIVMALVPLAAQAATHTVYWQAPAGGTYYAYPANQSLADWTTYRVALTGGTGADVGRYSGSLNDAHGMEWLVFNGSSMPTTWDAYVGSASVRQAIVQNAVDTEVAAIKAKTDNLPTDPADASAIAAALMSIASTLEDILDYVD
jgi:hypothetical protein